MVSAFFFIPNAKAVVISPANKANKPIIFIITSADVKGDDMRINPKITETIPPQINELSPLYCFFNLIPVISPDVPFRTATIPKNHIKKEMVRIALEKGLAKIIKPAIIRHTIAEQKAIGQKEKEHNQTWMQQKGYCRQEKFFSDEKQVLKPLPATNFEIKYYKELKVAQNNHILLSENKHYYSASYGHIGNKVKLIYIRTMVYIYAKGNQVAVHPRSYKIGGYST